MQSSLVKYYYNWIFTYFFAFSTLFVKEYSIKATWNYNLCTIEGATESFHAHIKLIEWISTKFDRSVFHFQTQPAEIQFVRKFWESEEIPEEKFLTQDEEFCEHFYSDTITRDWDGRFIVSLPKARTIEIEGSREIAIDCLIGWKNRRRKNPQLDRAYIDFMDEYLRLGHTEEVPSHQIQLPGCYYLPHHAIFCNDGSGKIRIVFNASHKCRNGLLLNKTLLPGPKLQTDLIAIIFRWRLFRIVFTSDLVKMFRQFKINPEDSNLQRIVWRSDMSSLFRITDFQLSSTVLIVLRFWHLDLCLLSLENCLNLMLLIFLNVKPVLMIFVVVKLSGRQLKFEISWYNCWIRLEFR